MTQATVPDARRRASAGSNIDGAGGREAQILDAASTLIARKGLGFSTRELADSVGVSQPLIYRYFPSKAALLDRIFDEVYLKRWDNFWTDILRDRSLPLSDRLVRYLRSYTDAILDRTWIRIFLASAIDDPAIAQRYLRMLHDATFSLIVQELVHESGAAIHRTARFDDLAQELVWGFHSSFFYLGVRKYVYGLPIPEPLGPIIQLKVDVFLAGMKGGGLAAIDAMANGEGQRCVV